MIPIILTIFIVIATIFSAFFSFTNNITALMDADLSGKAQANAVLYGLQFGQLCARANTLIVPGHREVQLGYLKKIKEKELEPVNCTINYIPQTGNINVTVSIK